MFNSTDMQEYQAKRHKDISKQWKCDLMLAMIDTRETKIDLGSILVVK